MRRAYATATPLRSGSDKSRLTPHSSEISRNAARVEGDTPFIGDLTSGIAPSKMAIAATPRNTRCSHLAARKSRGSGTFIVKSISRNGLSFMRSRYARATFLLRLSRYMASSARRTSSFKLSFEGWSSVT